MTTNNTSNISSESQSNTNSIEWGQSSGSIQAYAKSIVSVSSRSPELAASGLIYTIESSPTLNYTDSSINGVGICSGNWTFTDADTTVNVDEGGLFPNTAWLKYTSVSCWLVPSLIKTGFSSFKFATQKQSGVGWYPNNIRPGILKNTVSEYTEVGTMAVSALTTAKATPIQTTGATPANLTNGSQALTISTNSKLLVFLSGIHNGTTTKYLASVSLEINGSAVDVNGIFPDIGTVTSGTYSAGLVTYCALTNALSAGSKTVQWKGAKIGSASTETALLSGGVYAYEVPSTFATAQDTQATPATSAIYTVTKTVTFQQGSKALLFLSYKYPSTTSGQYSRFKFEVDTGSGFQRITGSDSDPYLVHYANNEFKYTSYLHISEPVGDGTSIDFKLTLQSTDIDCTDLNFIICEYR